jgi:hypothetical protein
VSGVSASQRVSQLSSDGSLLVYTTGSENGAGYVVPVRGGAADQFCNNCATAYDLSADNKLVLYRKGDAIRTFNLVSRRDSLLRQSIKNEIYQHKFSPDGRWVTFVAVHEPRLQVLIARVLDNAGWLRRIINGSVCPAMKAGPISRAGRRMAM